MSPEWRTGNISDLLRVLEIDREKWEEAVKQRGHVYVVWEKPDKKTGKRRILCFPHPDSLLRRVQEALNRCILLHLELAPEVRGYIIGSHNIKVAGELCCHEHVGKLDISKFHPSITGKHVAMALRKHGLSPEWARQIARLVTFKGRLPQGAPTSNFIANLVMDVILRRTVLPLAAQLRLEIRNYGDDIALCGSDPVAVRIGLTKAKNAIRKLGFQPNEKCRSSQHRGGNRVFIGCFTGRESPDYPRKAYRELRKQLRSLLQRELSRTPAEPSITDTELRSLHSRIDYVARLSARKARRLRDVLYRLQAAKRQLPGREGTVRPRTRDPKTLITASKRKRDSVAD